VQFEASTVSPQRIISDDASRAKSGFVLVLGVL